MDADVKGFGRVVGLSGERLRYYKRIMAFFNKYATFHFETYNSTDDVTNPQTNVIYLVGPKGNLDDKYEEYIYDNTKQDPWIKIGDTSIDLSQYATVAELIEELSNYTTTEDLNQLLNRKQNTEEGKGLSTNDFTDNLKSKLDGIQSGAQKNVNADWNSKSGDSQILNKPDLSGFITKTVNDLTNYYLKSEVYTKDQVAAIIATINQFHYEVHPTLNEIVSPQNNVLYLIGPTGTGSDKYEEYIYPSVETGWTKIGDTSIDLRNYVTIDTLNTALATKQDVISDLINIRAGAAAGATALQTIDETLTDQEFVYRICPSTINPKSIILNKIKGKTLVWNQLVTEFIATNYNNNNAVVSYNNNIMSFTASAAYGGAISKKQVYWLSGHKYLFSLWVNTSFTITSLRISSNNGYFSISVSSSSPGVWTKINKIVSNTQSDERLFIWDIRSSNFDEIQLKDLVIIDLTFLYGSEIDGLTDTEILAKYESDFGTGYHDYNAGKLISNDAKEIETVGFNQWDEEWEVGTINSSGEKADNSNIIRSKNYIPVIANEAYYYKTISDNAPFVLFFYDSNKSLISSQDGLNEVITTPSGTCYLRFRMSSAYGTKYNNNLCINLSDPSKNGTYEPYKKSKINLNLNSFKVKDSQGNIITISDGLKSAGNVHDEIIGDKYIKRVNILKLKELDWRYMNDNRFWAKLPNSPRIDTIQFVSSAARYNKATASIAYSDSPNLIMWSEILTAETTATTLRVRDVAANGNITSLINYMEEGEIVYELATPIEYELIEPIVPITKAGITEARISPNTDGLSAPFCGDITYTLADIYVPELKSINYITEITWSELKSLRDGGNLIPGMQYRITDYNCTTVQSNTQSANHQFDIIVIADDVNKLNENARACLHDGDTYFTNSKLESWKLKYNLDNDTIKFNWADSTNGKGVIYWMKDEWDNECPYDFKNIKFNKSNNWVYTFIDDRNNDNKDASILGYNNNVIGNKIKYIYDNKFYIPINTFKYGCKYNIINNDCTGNHFDYNCGYNVLNHYCNNNIFGNSCNSNVFEDYCSTNTLGNNCEYNSFGVNCNNNTLGNRCSNNNFENSCRNNNFKNSCGSNHLGVNCSNNSFETQCVFNTFIQSCSYNTFNTYVRSNILEINCSNINIQKSYVNNIIIENGNKYIDITSTQTTSNANKLQNFKIAQGVNNTTTVKTISHDTVNDIFQTVYKPLNSVETQV